MKKVVSFPVVFIIFVFCFTLNADDNLKPRLGEPPAKSQPYIFINEKTPSYLIENAVKKKIDLAFYLRSSDAGWMRKNINFFEKSSLLIFVKSPLTSLEKGYLDELVKMSEYRATIVCFSGNCGKESDWTHPLVRNNYVIGWKEEKNGPQIYMKKKNVVSKGTLLSATDIKDFRDLPDVTGAVHFKETGFSFISLDGATVKIPAEIWITVYYSRNEKKLKEFIEKKL